MVRAFDNNGSRSLGYDEFQRCAPGRQARAPAGPQMDCPPAGLWQGRDRAAPRCCDPRRHPMPTAFAPALPRPPPTQAAQLPCQRAAELQPARQGQHPQAQRGQLACRGGEVGCGGGAGGCQTWGRCMPAAACGMYEAAACCTCGAAPWRLQGRKLHAYAHAHGAALGGRQRAAPYAHHPLRHAHHPMRHAPRTDHPGPSNGRAEAGGLQPGPACGGGHGRRELAHRGRGWGSEGLDAGRPQHSVCCHRHVARRITRHHASPPKLLAPLTRRPWARCCPPPPSRPSPRRPRRSLTPTTPRASAWTSTSAAACSCRPRRARLRRSTRAARAASRRTLASLSTAAAT